MQFRIDGRMTQETFEIEKGAREFGALVDRVGGKAARAVLAARRNKGAETPTLREFTHRYLDLGSGLLTGIEPGTRAGYVVIAEKSFLKVLGDYPIDAIEKSDVGKWVAWQEAQPSSRRKGELMAAKTVKNYHALLSSVMGAAVEEKLRLDNPAFKTRLSSGVRRSGVFLSVAEFETIAHFLPERYKSIVLFLAGTGARWGEATAITWADLNLDAETPTVRIDKAWKKSASGPPVLKHPKSKRANRTISLWPELVDTLGVPGSPGELVFAGPLSGNHLWSGPFRSRVWLPTLERARDRDQCAAAGLTVVEKTPTVHDLRHTHASWLIAGGAPLPYVQARLGHENITTTVNTYGHLQPDAHVMMAGMMSSTMGRAVVRVQSEMRARTAALEALVSSDAASADEVVDAEWFEAALTRP
ncbi:site-specific integrase [Agromyces atrinae]|uniref:tyrosine-type recombinase/integrase n=1 Tax=Agromyces atrinae TaxID=592376 RepID=UPI001F5867D9|nr:site-specific integrase [Agromyces atrinae]MCI2958267.1 site-specific integrase [Agromyces atrinae]